MFSFALFTTLSLVPFVLGQSDDTKVQIEGIEAHFAQSKLVPDLLASFDPTAILAVNFDGVGDISTGQPIAADKVQSAPTITLTPANSSITFDGNYTIIMADPATAGSDQSGGVTRHWMLNYVTIADNKLDTGSVVAVTNYAGPAPPPGSGAHRYTILLFTQPAEFISPAEFGPDAGVATFTLSTYLSDSKMGPLVGGNYFTVEDGTSTVSVEATSAVESSTLASDSPSSSGSGTQTSSGSGSAPSASGGNSEDGGDGAATMKLGFATMSVGLMGAAMMILA